MKSILNRLNPLLRPIPLIGLVVLIAAVCGSGYFYAGQPRDDLKKRTFIKLAEIRDSKKEEVRNYFDSVRALAYSAQRDATLRTHFLAFQEKPENARLEYQLDEYCINKYGVFYDILFIDTDGLIFHSIRKEADYRTNLFHGKWSTTRLARQIKGGKEDVFVEYEFYKPSDEPAAFFAVTLKEGEKRNGWIVLQSAINQVNTILSDHAPLGRTGEIYLVNREQLMLTDSRFMEDSTILKLKVNTLAVKEAMTYSRGERILEDYRGVRVFSSFEKFRIFGTEWIIIAEIDEDEVITEHYRRHKQYLLERILPALPPPQSGRSKVLTRLPAGKRVDINEYAQAESGQRLNTYGVAACTAVAIHFPDRFSYLAHISPADKLYDDHWTTALWHTNPRGNFLDKLIQRIRHYRIYPHELKRLEFTIVAPHADSIGNAIDTILANGIEITNIKFIYNPGAIGANVSLDGRSGDLLVQWYDEKSTFLQPASGVRDLGKIIKTFAGREA
ncbi:MAG: hypothetical protein GY697_10425 [Desulfobacterales bacterium]|nr:hypothetical protein [Desulfobacterales bacterium]